MSRSELSRRQGLMVIGLGLGVLVTGCRFQGMRRGNQAEGKECDLSRTIPFPGGGSIGWDEKQERLWVLDAQGQPVAVYAEVNPDDKFWTETQCFSNGVRVLVYGHTAKPGQLSSPVGWIAEDAQGNKIGEGGITP